MKQDLEQVAGWLKTLYPTGTPGMVWIGSKSTGFRGRRFHPTQLQDMLAEVKKLDRDPGIFVRMTTIRPEANKRGEATDSVALAGLWADLDIAGPGHKHDPSRYEGRQLPPDEDTARLLVDFLPEPSAWVRSGGGLYPFWLPERPWDVSTPEAQQRYGELSADLQEAIGARAAELGWHYGTGVGDIARILRIPGTVNRKVDGQPRACEIEWGGGPRYTYEELRAVVPVGSRRAPAAPSSPSQPVPVLPAPPAPPVRPRTRLVAPAPPQFDDSGPGPFDAFAARNDLHQLLEQDGWTFAYEAQGRRHYARPGKSPRDGVSGNVYVEQGRQVLYVFSESAGLPTFRGLSVGEWYAWRYHGGDLRAAGQALRRAGYGAPVSETAPTTRLAGPGSARQAAPGMSAPAGALELASNVAGEVWDERPVLRAIRSLARRRRVGPWAVLGGVLAHVACRVGPHVVLPPIVGGVASLNLFVGLVGPSGAGKGAATAVAAELLGSAAHQTPVKKLGTGQGVDASFTAQTKEGPVQFNDTALFTIGEIDSLAAHASMNGSTLMATLREVYSGEALGAHYADRFKRRPVRAHHYRAAIIAGIQPARAGVLLDDADGGTPQRWLWFPTNDPGRRQPTQRRLVGPAPDQWWTDYEVWMPHGEQPEDEPVERKAETEIPVCASAQQAIWAARDARLDMDLAEQANDLSGHALLTRLKVAALLGFLDGRCQVSEADWELAARIQLVSEQTRALCQNVMAERAEREAVRRGRARARTDQAAAEEATEIGDKKRSKVAEKVMAKLQATPGEWVARRILSVALGRDRAHLDGALDELLADGLAEKRVINPGTGQESTQIRSVVR